jgi:hypothetical protein
LEKELNNNAPKSEGLNLPVSQPALEQEEDDNGFAKTTNDDRRNMAKSFSNSEEGVMLPSSHAPVSNFSSTPQYPSPSYSSYGTEENNSPQTYGQQNMMQQNTSFSNSSDRSAHRIEVMERQIEILSSKIDLLKVNVEAISSKLSVIDQKIDKKLSNPWM